MGVLMVDIIEGMNIKEAVLFCMFIMVLLNALLVIGFIGIFALFQSHAREKLASEIRTRLSKIERSLLDIL